MAFEEIDPKYTFHYNESDIESIRQALQVYAEWILTGEAFHNNYCAVQFNPEKKHVLISEFEAYPTIHSFLKDQLSNCEPDENIKDNLLTETLLFAFALCHPELKDEVVNTCKAFVTFARAINDSSEMWITCEEPFAINPLLLLAYTYPEYGYLLASFYVPYWDDEHMPESLYSIEPWINTFGLTPDTIKAFCYCDNARVREIMLGYDSYNDTKLPIEKNHFDLISYLRQSKNNYKAFVDILTQRYKAMPYLPYSESDKDSRINPIADIVLNMMYLHYPYNTWDDDFDIDEYFTQTFIYESAEKEIAEIKESIEDELEHPIVDFGVFKQNKALLKYDPDQYQNNDTVTSSDEDPLANWQTFITHALPNGENIWEYIAEGTHTEVLENIEPANVFYLAENGRYALYHELEEESYNMRSMWEDLHDILKPMYKKRVLWGIKNKVSDTTNNEILHRLIDVLFILNAKTPLTEDFKEFVCDYVGYLTEEEYDKRYAAPWFTKLEHSLNAFSSYHEFVYREHVNEFMKIVLNNYKEAVEVLPEKLFNTEKESEDLEDRLSRKYDKIEIAVLAVYLLQYQQPLKVKDALVDAARQYLNKYTTGLLFYNLLEATSYPRPDWIQDIRNGNTKHMAPHLLDEYQQIAELIDELEQYIYNGFIKNGESAISSWESEQKTIAILNTQLKCDRDVISERQKQYDWFCSSNESTQKLLTIAHVASKLKGLNCADTSARYLRVAFHFAPVRTAQLLAKTYKIDKYKVDNTDYMLQMLHSFKQQGLSNQGYWAYILEEFVEDRDANKNKYFKSIIKEWEKGFHSSPSDNYEVEYDVSFIYSTEQQERLELAKGFELIPNRTQLEVLEYATKQMHILSLKDKYDEFLIKRVIRGLTKETFTISDVPIYFKNRLQHEGYYCEFIEWDKWKDHPEVVKQLFNIEVKKPEELESTNYEKELHKSRAWKYIVVQRRGTELVPIIGQKELWLIQQIFANPEELNHCHTRLIVIDETCPGENLFELTQYCKMDYKKMVVEKTEAYLKDPECNEEEIVERFFHFGMYHYEFLGRNGFFDFDIEDIIENVSWVLKAKILRLLGLVSSDCLNLEMHLKPTEYYELLLACNVDKQAILRYLLKHKLLIQIQHLSRKIDYSNIIEDEKLVDQMAILSCVAPIPEYHPLILKYEKHKSAKMQKHIQALKEKFKINQFDAEQFHIVDYGVFVMKGSTEPEAGSTNKVAQEPVCTQQTTNIKAEIGMFVGFRFTAINPDTVPKVIVHTVEVKHPIIDNTGDNKYNTVKWNQNGYSNSNVFLGWHFENTDELIPGEYHISAIDMEGKIIAQKLFDVKV
nr:DUF3859 domain-containing protein [uncultured Carboxylicivirga sp.]